MKTLADVKRRLRVGGRILCVENTLIPKYNGQERVIAKVQTNGFYWTSDGDNQRKWTPLPKASDLAIIDADTVQFRWFVDRKGFTQGHYVRLRFLD